MNFAQMIELEWEQLYATRTEEEFIRIKQKNFPTKFDEEFFFRGSGDDLCHIHHIYYVNGHVHRHSFFELMYVYRGHCHQIMGGEKIHMSAGDVCILNLQSEHHVYIEDKDTILINVLIKPELFEKSFLGLLSDNNLLSNFIVNSLYDERNRCDYLYFPASDSSSSLVSLVEQLIMEDMTKHICYKSAIECTLGMIFVEMARIRNRQFDADSAQNLGGHTITEVITYISEHYANISLTQIAEHFHYHPNYLSSLIKKFCGMSFSSFLMDYKIKNACRMLKNSDQSVSQIAELVGFEDRSYFNRAFKKQTGLSPTAYRTGGGEAGLRG